MKQAALVVALLLPAVAAAQRFPDATELLANVRLRQSQQEIDLRGQLRQDAKIVPFHLVQNGPVVRYIFTNPDETLQVRIGVNDSRLDEIKRELIRRQRKQLPQLDSKNAAQVVRSRLRKTHGL